MVSFRDQKMTIIPTVNWEPWISFMTGCLAGRPGVKWKSGNRNILSMLGPLLWDGESSTLERDPGEIILPFTLPVLYFPIKLEIRSSNKVERHTGSSRMELKALLKKLVLPQVKK